MPRRAAQLQRGQEERWEWAAHRHCAKPPSRPSRSPVSPALCSAVGQEQPHPRAQLCLFPQKGDYSTPQRPHATKTPSTCPLQDSAASHPLLSRPDTRPQPRPAEQSHPMLPQAGHTRVVWLTSFLPHLAQAVSENNTGCEGGSLTPTHTWLNPKPSKPAAAVSVLIFSLA